MSYLKQMSRCVLSLALLVALLAPVCVADKDPDRKKFAELIAKELHRLGVHHVAVPDFADASGVVTQEGWYLAASFSKFLGEKKKDYEVLNRNDLRRVLREHGWSPSDLVNPDALQVVSKETGADGFLTATFIITSKAIILDFSLRDGSTAKELYRTHYKERRTPSFDANFPASTDDSKQTLYFAELDGVGIPKCRHCPNPSYTESARGRRVEGSLVLSVVITEQGTPTSIRLVQGLEFTLDQTAIAAVGEWSFDPARDASGKPVPVRLAIEVTFRLYY